MHCPMYVTMSSPRFQICITQGLFEYHQFEAASPTAASQESGVKQELPALNVLSPTHTTVGDHPPCVPHLITRQNSDDIRQELQRDE